jgi:hypothetical protein
MSPSGQMQGRKIEAPSNVYTAILAMVFFIVLATAVLVTCLSYSQYEVFLKAAGN